jgi:hypothetical protein
MVYFLFLAGIIAENTPFTASGAGLLKAGQEICYGVAVT